MYTFSPATKAKSAEVNQNFTDLSTGIADTDDNRLALMRQETWNSFAEAGCVWSQTSGLTGAMTAGIVYVSNGVVRLRSTVAAITSKVFTASKDTYVTIGSAGVPFYTEVANGATPPSYPANHMPLAKVVTSGAAITNIHMLCPRNPDEIGRITVVMGLTDNLIIPNLPARKFLTINAAVIAAGSITVNLRFNNDSSTNYARRDSSDGAADTTSVSQTSISVGSSASKIYATYEIMNLLTEEKNVNYKFSFVAASGAANAPSRQEGAGKWANPGAQITRIDIVNANAGDYAVNTEIVIRGVD